jgi:hypothetical protein
MLSMIALSYTHCRQRQVLSAKMYPHQREEPGFSQRGSGGDPVGKKGSIRPGLAENERRKIFKGDWTYV